MPSFLARVLVATAIGAVVVAFFALGLDRTLTLEALQTEQARLAAYQAGHPWQAAAVFFLFYVVVAAASLPGAALLTVAGGAIFGLVAGTVLASAASTVGASLAFLTSRFLLRDVVQRRFSRRLAAVDAGMARDGVLYLLSLRLVPVLPFVVVNLLMGLTAIPIWTFALVSQAGMLPGTLVYVSAGTALASVTSLGELLSPGVLASFAMLALLPLAARALLDRLRAIAIYRPFAHLRPTTFDYNVVVIGAGAAGLVAANLAATLRATVALVERDRMGGDCLHTGCVPSKALLRVAGLVADIRRATSFGVRVSEPEVDFAGVMAHVRRAIAQIAPHDSTERYTRLGVECLLGRARVTSPWTIEVTEADGRMRTLTTKSIIVAAGARPAIPPIPGLADAAPYTSDTVWQLPALPRRLVVLGGGAIGCELAQAFQRLGSQVTIVEVASRLVPREDPEATSLLLARFESEGLTVRLGHRVLGVERAGSETRLTIAEGATVTTVAADAVLCATGRVATTSGYGLEELGITAGEDAARSLPVDGFMATRVPNVFACGDVAGPLQFTHTAAHSAWHAVANALFGGVRRVRIDLSVVPRVTFTDPEIAQVGLSEPDATAQGLAFDVTTYRWRGLDRAVTDGRPDGFVRVLTRPRTDAILGATIVGVHAGELIAELALAMRHGLGLGAVLATIHAYPTMSEANRHVAGLWRRGRMTRGQQATLAVYQAWRRGAASLGDVVAAVPQLIRDRRPAESAADVHET